MDILVVHLFNALLYASVLFLIAGGLSLIYGVMRIVNLAHGNLFAIGAFLTASAVGQWFAGSESALLYLLLPIGAFGAAVLGAVIEPTLLRPFYRRPEEYQLLVTFGLLMILEDVMRFVWGPYPVSASVLFEKLGSLHVGEGLAFPGSSGVPQPDVDGIVCGSHAEERLRLSAKELDRCHVLEVLRAQSCQVGGVVVPGESNRQRVAVV